MKKGEVLSRSTVKAGSEYTHPGLVGTAFSPSGNWILHEYPVVKLRAGQYIPAAGKAEILLPSRVEGNGFYMVMGCDLGSGMIVGAGGPLTVLKKVVKVTCEGEKWETGNWFLKGKLV